MSLGDEKYILLTTYRRSGEGVSTPVWSVPLDGDRFGFYTSSGSGKGKRLAHTSRVTVQPCNVRGKVKDGSSPTECTAQLVTGGELESIRAKVKSKYGVMVPVTRTLASIGDKIKRRSMPYADRGVVVTPSS